MTSTDDIERINTGDPPFAIEETGHTETTWIVDAEEEGVPKPRHFRDLGAAGSKLVVLSTFLPEPYASEAERIYKDVARLQRMMARERLDDEQAIGNLCLGNLEELPEVEAEREFVRTGGESDAK